MSHFVVTQISNHGYLAVLILMVLESACIPIPSEAIMLFGGALAGGLTVAGVHPDLNVWGVAAAGAAGNVIGSAIAYAVGRAGGRPLIERWGRYILLRTRDLDKAEDFFRRKGDVAVLIGRVLPVIRTFISLPAGIAEMPVVRFLVFTLLGSIPWTVALALAGDAVAENWHQVERYFTVVTVIIAVIVVAAIVFWALRRLQSRQLPAQQGQKSEGASAQR
ncbi:MAG: DedA family protein [Acidimicrobiaceae bacterium]|nr:DedA family protein [Acidimicrobiaceae bacterium]